MGAILCASDVLEVRGGKDESCFDEEKQTTSTGSNQSMKLSTAVILISVYC